MKPNLNELLKQVQKMQADLDRFNSEFGDRTFEFDAGAGAVKVVINGKKEILGLNIQKEIINADDKEILEDLVIAAVNKAIREVEKIYQEELQQRTKGMIPPGINIPGF
ncbi:MAG: YbaB/EbfC family nucleoid-associated protein [Ignavibacteria bacterium]|jgi:DNA-binding YbaB/EbfC family protein|nr:YbaB/EbfC family nucleoid-associated protein [Ignavibacteria bacterium]MDH7527653.1 YbaB/EbfC family nucleoid-associated protein [Ignavibacteria bacterium]NPV12175.1 YbaB/EbfC family nucleoid-associated protein [Ignavibacteria bacterium]